MPSQNIETLAKFEDKGRGKKDKNTETLAIERQNGGESREIINFGWSQDMTRIYNPAGSPA